MPEIVARESKVNAILKQLRDWKEGPRPPSDAEFNVTIALLIEKLQELEVGDNEWESA
jgi:hypothetical protein